MTKTKYEIELETKLLKAWAETVYEKHLRQEAVQTLQELNQRVHGGYDFNADPDNMTARVSGEITKQLFAIHRASNEKAEP